MCGQVIRDKHEFDQPGSKLSQGTGTTPDAAKQAHTRGQIRQSTIDHPARLLADCPRCPTAFDSLLLLL